MEEKLRQRRKRILADRRARSAGPSSASFLGGRVIIPAGESHYSNQKEKAGARDKAKTNTVSVISYNILASCCEKRCAFASPECLSWARRRGVLLKEMLALRADVVCLQDVDRFSDFWEPQLGLAGYDVIFKKRTDALCVRHEGVAIAWRRDAFQLFQSESFDMNRLAEQEKDARLAARAEVADNVAVMVLLLPWEASEAPCGLCVASAQLYEEDGLMGDSVRELQTRGLMRTLEAFNGDFGLPPVICGTFNFVPTSTAYAVCVTGERPIDPGPPPCSVAETHCRGDQHLECLSKVVPWKGRDWR